MRQTTYPELAARIESGETGFLSWLRSSERREQFLSLRKDSAATRFLAGYWRKVETLHPGMNMLLNIGSGVGAHADAVLRTGSETIRYVGMDPDPNALSCAEEGSVL